MGGVDASPPPDEDRNDTLLFSLTEEDYDRIDDYYDDLLGDVMDAVDYVEDLRRKAEQAWFEFEDCKLNDLFTDDWRKTPQQKIQYLEQGALQCKTKLDEVQVKFAKAGLADVASALEADDWGEIPQQKIEQLEQMALHVKFAEAGLADVASALKARGKKERCVGTPGTLFGAGTILGTDSCSMTETDREDTEFTLFDPQTTSKDRTSLHIARRLGRKKIFGHLGRLSSVALLALFASMGGTSVGGKMLAASVDGVDTFRGGGVLGRKHIRVRNESTGPGIATDTQHSPFSKANPTSNENEKDIKKAGHASSNAPISSYESAVEGLAFAARNLRGKANSGTVVDEKTATVARSFFEHLKSVQMHAYAGNKDEVGAAMKLAIGTVTDDLPQEESSMRLEWMDASKSLALNELPNAALAELVSLQDLDKIVDMAEKTVYLAEIGLGEGIYQDEGAHPSSNAFSQESDSPRADQNPMHMHMPRTTNRHPVSTLGASFHKDPIVFAKHQAREEALGDTVCPADCNIKGPKFAECNCRKLVGCVQRMSKLDLAKLITGGYIDTNHASNTYGRFRVGAAALNLYDIQNGIEQKLDNIQSFDACNSASCDIGVCANILDELFTACPLDGQSCTDPNIETFPVTVEDVCNAIDSSTKLSFEVIAEKFDGMADSIPPTTYYSTSLDAAACGTDDGILTPQQCEFVSYRNGFDYGQESSLATYPQGCVCSRHNTCFYNKRTGAANKNGFLWCKGTGDSQSLPLSYHICRDFVAEFDRFYKLKPLNFNNFGPEQNPMRKTAGTALEELTVLDIYNHVQFPTSYMFLQDLNTGIQDRSSIVPDLKGSSGNFRFRNAEGKMIDHSGSGTCNPCESSCSFIAQGVSGGSSKFAINNVGHLMIIPTGYCYPSRFVVPNSCNSLMISPTGSAGWRHDMDGGLHNVDCGGKFVSVNEAGAIVMLAKEKEGDALNSTQKWTAVFDSPPYNYALTALGFPTSQLRSTMQEPKLVRSVMHACDQSMSLLLGSRTSLGTLRILTDHLAAAALEDRANLMPGKCCFDTPTSNTRYFGNAYDPSRTCRITGPWHLGISAEACENAGGKYSRMPCSALKEAIMNRTSRFNFTNPQYGVALEQPITAYVSASLSHAVFDSTQDKFKFGKTTAGCLEFCRSLPNYSAQTGMLITPMGSSGGPSAWYMAGTFNIGDLSWPDSTSGGNHASLTGAGFERRTESGQHGAKGTVVSLAGTYADQISFGNIIEDHFTICSVTRYAGSRKYRILQGGGKNWYHGHHGGKTGVAHYGALNTAHVSAVTPIINWVVMCGTNSESQLKLVNGIDVGTRDAGSGGVSLWVNGGQVPSEKSDFAVAEVVVWDRGLAADEMYAASSYLMNKFHLSSMPDDSASVSNCQCLYKNGMVPEATTLPEYATRSPPKFFLKNTASSAGLGLHSMDCGADITLEVQAHMKTARQQFYLSKDRQIVSVACPNKVLSSDCTTAVFVDNNNEASTKWQIGGGSISNDLCTGTDKVITAIIDKKPILHSKFFNIVHASSQMVMTAAGGCTGGITLEKAMLGQTNQLFFKEGDKIVSLKCPHLALSTALPCDNSVGVVSLPLLLHAKAEATEWSVEENSMVVTSAACRTGWMLTVETAQQCLGFATCQAKLAPTAGEGITIQQRLGTGSSRQKFSTNRQMFSSLIGPFSFSGEASFSLGTAIASIGVEGASCTAGMPLKLLPDDPRSQNQKFYTSINSTSGVIIHSSMCPGLIVTPSTGCAEVPLELDVFVGNSDSRWKMEGGYLTSTKCAGKVMGVGTNDISIMLQEKVQLSSTNQLWRRVNTYLLATSGATNEISTWNVDFVEPFSELSTGPGDLDTSTSIYYNSSKAFSQSFEEFAGALNITDDTDEDQCRKVREELAFDKDHPYDLEVCEKFNEYQCNIQFTGVDHLSEGLDEPPTFAEKDFEAPEYPEDAELSDTYKEISVPVEMTAHTDMEKKTPALNQLQDAWLAHKHVLMIVEHAFDVAKEYLDGMCELIPPSIPTPPGCIPNAGRYVCETAYFIGITVARGIYFAAELAYDILDSKFEKDTLGPGEMLDMSYQVSDLHGNVNKFQEWTYHALQDINNHIHTQHTEMRKHLQDRHQQMTHDIFEVIEDSTNVISRYFTSQSIWLKQNLCAVYKKVASVTSCIEADNEMLLSLVGLSLWEKGNAMNDKLNMLETKIDATFDTKKGKMKDKTDEQSVALHDQKGEIESRDHSSSQNKMDFEKEQGDTMDDKLMMLEAKIDAHFDTMKQEINGEMKGMEDRIKQLIENIEKKLRFVEN